MRRIVGNEEVINSLKNRIDSGSHIQNFLLWGPARVGKKTIGRSCAAYLEGFHDDQGDFVAFENNVPLLDYLEIVPDNNRTIGIDVVRQIREFMSTRPFKSRYRLVLIDKSECLTIEAQNALLKIAEEPPLSGLVILITADYGGLRDTLVSRFQKLYCRRVSDILLQTWLCAELKMSLAQAEATAAISFGEPGRAYALLNDKHFMSIRDQAKIFLKSDGSRRKEYIKQLLSGESFNLSQFLDALIEVSILENRKIDSMTARKKVLLHQLFALRQNAEYFNLNQRLQLEALALNI